MEHNTNDLSTNAFIQQVKNGYDMAKHSCRIMENTLNNVECYMQNTLPFYQQFYQQYLQTIIHNYSTGIEYTKSTFERMKSILMTAFVYTIGIIVVLTQSCLALNIAIINILIASFINSKHFITSVFISIKNAEESIDKFRLNTIQQTRNIIQVILTKLNEYANIVLDITDALMDRLLGSEIETPKYNGNIISERLSHIAYRLYNFLTNNTLVDPIYQQINIITQQFAKSIVLLDLIREQQGWAFDKANEIHSSITKLKERIEYESLQLKQKPEEILLNSLRHSSKQLIKNLIILQNSANEVLSESAISKVKNAVNYFEQFGDNLTNASDIYKVNDEIVNEAHERLLELAQWTSNWMTTQNTAKQSD